MGERNEGGGGGLFSRLRRTSYETLVFVLRFPCRFTLRNDCSSAAIFCTLVPTTFKLFVCRILVLFVLLGFMLQEDRLGESNERSKFIHLSHDSVHA